MRVENQEKNISKSRLADGFKSKQSIFQRKRETSASFNSVLIVPPIEAVKTPKQFFKDFTASERRVLDYFIHMELRVKEVFPTQTKIGEAVGLCRQQVNVIIGKLIGMGLIASNYFHKSSCTYKLSHYFYITQITRKLVKVFSGLALLVSLTSFFRIDATQLDQISPFMIAELYSKVVTNSQLNEVNHVRDPQDGTPHQKERKMNGESHEAEFQIPEYILNIRSLKLTVAGQIKLCGFDEEAIKSADQKVSRSKSLKDPFWFFFKLCNEWHKQANSQPNWKVVDFIRMKMGISEDTPLTTQPTNAKPAAPSYGTNPRPTNQSAQKKENNQQEKIQQFVTCEPHTRTTEVLIAEMEKINQLKKNSAQNAGFNKLLGADSAELYLDSCLNNLTREYTRAVAYPEMAGTRSEAVINDEIFKYDVLMRQKHTANNNASALQDVERMVAALKRELNGEISITPCDNECRIESHQGDGLDNPENEIIVKQEISEMSLDELIKLSNDIDSDEEKYLQEEVDSDEEKYLQEERDALRDLPTIETIETYTFDEPPSNVLYENGSEVDEYGCVIGDQI